MVESLVIKEYTRNRLQTLEEVLDKKNTGYSTEDFHTIRVEIKKLNAISRILKFCYRPFKRNNTCVILLVVENSPRTGAYG